MLEDVINFINTHISIQSANSTDPLLFEPHILVIQDISGSTLLDQAVRQRAVGDVLSSALNSKITHVAADTRVRAIVTKDPGEQLSDEEHTRLVNSARGGTDMFMAAVQAISRPDVKYTVVVIISDGMTQPMDYAQLQALPLKGSGINTFTIPPLVFLTVPDSPTFDPKQYLIEGCTGYPPGALLIENGDQHFSTKEIGTSPSP